jgi:hypothetical protein
MVKKIQASSATKKVATAKTTRRKKVTNTLKLLAPGDIVRLSLKIHNQYAGYDPRLLREEGVGRQIDGIVLSIREIATGKLVPLASGKFSEYVLEIIHNRSFDPTFASLQNAGKVIPGERGRISPLREKVQQLLRQMAKERKLLSISDKTFSASPVGNLLDGCRVIKVRADEVEASE